MSYLSQLSCAIHTNKYVPSKHKRNRRNLSKPNKLSGCRLMAASAILLAFMLCVPFLFAHPPRAPNTHKTKNSFSTNKSYTIHICTTCKSNIFVNVSLLFLSSCSFLKALRIYIYYMTSIVVQRDYR